MKILVCSGDQNSENSFINFMVTFNRYLIDSYIYIAGLLSSI